VRLNAIEGVFGLKIALKKSLLELKIFFEMLKSWVKWGEGNPPNADVLSAI